MLRVVCAHIIINGCTRRSVIADAPENVIYKRHQQRTCHGSGWLIFADLWSRRPRFGPVLIYVVFLGVRTVTGAIFCPVLRVLPVVIQLLPLTHSLSHRRCIILTWNGFVQSLTRSKQIICRLVLEIKRVPAKLYIDSVVLFGLSLPGFNCADLLGNF